MLVETDGDDGREQEEEEQDRNTFHPNVTLFAHMEYAPAETKYAKDAGATAALIVTPFYMKPADRGIYEHFYTIANEVDIPIILYNIPQCTGLELPWQMVEDQGIPV
jgi:hypothetical protein